MARTFSPFMARREQKLCRNACGRCSRSWAAARRTLFDHLQGERQAVEVDTHAGARLGGSSAPANISIEASAEWRTVGRLRSVERELVLEEEVGRARPLRPHVGR